MTIDMNLSIGGVLVILVVLMFFIAWESERRSQDAIHRLRMEHSNRLGELRHENRQLKGELGRLARQVRLLEGRMLRL